MTRTLQIGSRIKEAFSNLNGPDLRSIVSEFGTFYLLVGVFLGWDKFGETLKEGLQLALHPELLAALAQQTIVPALGALLLVDAGLYLLDKRSPSNPILRDTLHPVERPSVDGVLRMFKAVTEGPFIETVAMAGWYKAFSSLKHLGVTDEYTAFITAYTFAIAHMQAPRSLRGLLVSFPAVVFALAIQQGQEGMAWGLHFVYNGLVIALMLMGAQIYRRLKAVE